MKLYKACKGLAPGKDLICYPDTGWNIHLEDGEIKAWNVTGVDQPTTQELQTWWDANGLDAVKADRKIDAKAEASRHIITAGLNSDIGTFLNLPEWKQRNLAARASELIEKKADDETLTQDEIDELDAIRAIWTSVKDIRTRSDNIESDIDACATENDVNSLDIPGSTRWTE